MKRLVRPLAIVMTVLALAACVDRKADTTLNPDGSGKVVILQTMVPPPEMGEAKPDPVKLAKNAMALFVSQAQGVDAWKDVSSKVTDDGSIEIKATAYFPDISKLQMEPAPKVSWTKDEKGVATLQLEERKPPATAASQPVLTDEQVAAEMNKQRMQFKQMKPMMQAMFATLRLEMNFTLPGKVTEAVIYEKAGDDKVTLVFEGKKVIAAMDAVMKDDAKLEKMVRSGTKMDQDMGELVFGKKGPAKVVVAEPTKAMLDYKAESEAAKGAQAEMFKKLDIDPTKKPNGFGSMPDGTP